MLTDDANGHKESFRITYCGGVLWMIRGRHASYISVDDGVSYG